MYEQLKRGSRRKTTQVNNLAYTSRREQVASPSRRSNILLVYDEIFIEITTYNY
jgi:hypothetical protein